MRVVKVICVGVFPVPPIALKLRVPTVVGFCMVFVGSDPTETDAAIVSVFETGPSTMSGNATVLGENGEVIAGMTFVGSYFI